ncbi:MAG: hypothetical protein Q8Q09_07000 [Deltaproteobacteria bacterium]|nr:hypothetical protein [Deltaproteobacteria bacterium]
MAGDPRDELAFYKHQAERLICRAAECSGDSVRTDELLWHCRRALESLFAALLLAKGEDPHNGPTLATLDELQNRLAKTYLTAMRQGGLDVRTKITLLRNATNAGSHAVALRQVPRTPVGARASHSGIDSPLQPALDQLRRELTDVVHWCYALNDWSVAAIDQPLADIARGVAPKRSEPVQARTLWLVSAVSLVLGGAVWAGVSSLFARPVHTAEAPLAGPLHAPTVTDNEPPTDALQAPSDDAQITADLQHEMTTEPSTPASPGTCLDGWIAITADARVINPPSDRRDWHRPRQGSIAPAVSVCLQPALVTVAEYNRCVPSGRCGSLTAEIANNAVCRTAREGSPQRCVTYDEAKHYCEWFGQLNHRDNAHIARVAEWENLTLPSPAIDLPDHQDDPDHRQGEWVDDAAFPAYWGGIDHRRARHLWRMSGHISGSHLRHSWNLRDDTQQRFERIGFRCAYDR